MNASLRKIAVAAIALVLTLGMSVSVFAAGSTNPANPATGTNQIVIEKNLKVSNPDLTSVDGPGLTMNYAIAPVAPSAENGGTTITDADNHTGTVHQGIADGVTLSAESISWPIGTAVDASAAGADNVKSITATVDLEKFTVPGIYRYQLTETVDTDTSATGAEGEIRYIDVYIANGDEGLEVSGVVMHTGATAEGKPSQKKTFSPEEFETLNITLQKTVSGNMADKSNQFPFAGTVTDNGRYFYADKGQAVPTTQVAGAAGGSAVSTTLAHTEMYYISGLSHEAAVAYTETNNTSDTYQTSITGGTASAATAVEAGATKAMDSTDVDDAGAVVFNNNLDSVSPTGVIMRFGPYIAMIAVAAALVFVRRRAASEK